jgi:hypothetical protein
MNLDTIYREALEYEKIGESTNDLSHAWSELEYQGFGIRVRSVRPSGRPTVLRSRFSSLASGTRKPVRILYML